ncbi:hypothetical protein EAF04_007607 [Stromatinia cepivora]|nr:hypothetical protein EAF04_007607 [Stromatinia cepivora]
MFSSRIKDYIPEKDVKPGDLDGYKYYKTKTVTVTADGKEREASIKVYENSKGQHKQVLIGPIRSSSSKTEKSGSRHSGGDYVSYESRTTTVTGGREQRPALINFAMNQTVVVNNTTGSGDHKKHRRHGDSHRERDRGERDRGERDRGERDRGERDRGERDRGERDRGERDRGERDRGERDRPRDSGRRDNKDLLRDSDRGDRDRRRDESDTDDREKRRRDRQDVKPSNSKAPYRGHSRTRKSDNSGRDKERRLDYDSESDDLRRKSFKEAPSIAPSERQGSVREGSLKEPAVREPSVRSLTNTAPLEGNVSARGGSLREPSLEEPSLRSYTSQGYSQTSSRKPESNRPRSPLVSPPPSVGKPTSVHLNRSNSMGNESQNANLSVRSLANSLKQTRLDGDNGSIANSNATAAQYKRNAERRRSERRNPDKVDELNDMER